MAVMVGAIADGSFGNGETGLSRGEAFDENYALPPPGSPVEELWAADF